jgi:hypothetical protein
MAKSKSKKSYVLRVRLDAWQLVKLQSYAENHKRTVSDVVRAYIGRLPVQGRLLDVVTESETPET